MMTGLKEALQNISSKPVSDEELEQGTRHLIGFAKCLLTMQREILDNESNNINQSINKMQEEGLSLLAQSNRLHEYAERKGLEIIKSFEIVESSTRGERKQFMEMINFCKKQRETIAIVADTVDRVQRSFKESVLLDELMRQNKIELHFYREGMVLNSQSTSVDIMRWDFSVMGAKAYVLQLSENVRRSNEQKNKNGEITGLAPLGYENYIDERGKHFVRQKEPDATIIRKCYEMYSLGRASVAEIQHYANMMGLRTRKGAPISVNTMHFILENPFYYGEMKTKRGLMPHIYKPLVNKELWDMCQAQKAIRAGQFLRTSDKNLLYRGLIICGVTNRQCPCELKKDVFSYVACWRKDKTRIYIREEEFTKQIRSILNRIKLPDCIVIELQKELKTAKASERKFCTEEIARLKTEQTRLKQKMDVLFDMRLDGELDRETFDLKRNELQVKITRLNNKIVAHEKADNSFDETILGLLDIATQAGYIFEKSSNVDLKRLLLKFVFENITLTEGQISYKLRFPFNEFANLTTPKKNKPTSYEPTPNLINLSVRANNNQNVQSGYMNFCEPRFTDKNQGVTSKNATPLQSGWGGWIRTNE
ncbi:MAG: recombinase family protein [Alphaproteobacteria bacterium]